MSCTFVLDLGADTVHDRQTDGRTGKTRNAAYYSNPEVTPSSVNTLSGVLRNTKAADIAKIFPR